MDQQCKSETKQKTRKNCESNILYSDLKKIQKQSAGGWVYQNKEMTEKTSAKWFMVNV